jgi:ribonucleoside-diphosphate reductase alpha chain
MVVLRARYLHGEGQAQETPAEMLWRVATTVAEAEEAYGCAVEPRARAFYEVMAHRRFLPNSPTLGNAGRAQGQLSACFVLPIEDSLDAIFEAVKSAARIHGTGGGTGFSFSRLRPKDDPVRGYGRASGPVAFMDVFDAATGAVKQGGVRRGANMGILRVDHPDIREFVSAKRHTGRLSHFNISVAITDAFMGALREGGRYELRHPNTDQAIGDLSAQMLWDELCMSAWTTGDPGLVFIDRINAAHPTPALGEIESTNPCGELPLLPFESCNLGSVNLARHLTPEGEIDYAALRDTIRLGVRFLDDVIDRNNFPLPQIADMTRTTRKIGLGVMGWADLLIALGIPYASQAALELAHELGSVLLSTAREASRELALERGPFPAWGESRLAREVAGGPLRNSTVTTVAPTGTISILAGCSSGIEPLYALAYRRRALGGTTQLHFTLPALEERARAEGWWSESLEAHVHSTGGLSGLALPAEARELFRTAHDIEPDWHVRHQAAWQAHIENAVSKTVNLPASAQPADVSAVYRQAYDLGCKGITVYRDGSHEDQVLVSGPACGGPECAEPGL